MAKSRKPCVGSPSLLARVNSIDTTKKVLEEFLSGMSEWTDSREWRLPATKEAYESTCFFKREAAFYWDGVFKAIGDFWKGFVPQNTEKNTKWAVSTFKQWIVSRNQCSAMGETIDVDIPSKPVDKDSECTELCRVRVFLLLKPAKPTVIRIHPKQCSNYLLDCYAMLTLDLCSRIPTFWITRKWGSGSWKVPWIRIFKNSDREVLGPRSNTVAPFLLMNILGARNFRHIYTTLQTAECCSSVGFSYIRRAFSKRWPVWACFTFSGAFACNMLVAPVARKLWLVRCTIPASLHIIGNIFCSLCFSNRNFGIPLTTGGITHFSNRGKVKAILTQCIFRNFFHVQIEKTHMTLLLVFCICVSVRRHNFIPSWQAECDPTRSSEINTAFGRTSAIDYGASIQYNS